MSSTSPFTAFIPLANWTLGFDRYRQSYSKKRTPNARHPGRFHMLSAQDDFSIGIQKAQALAQRLTPGFPQVVWIESLLPEGSGLMEPNRFSGTGIGWAWPDDEIPLSRFGFLEPDGSLAEARHERISALAHKAARAGSLLDWNTFAPRSFSVLPIAKACHARCAFCFSKASASDAARQEPLDLGLARAWAQAAKSRGAFRSVITGGGEPTLLEQTRLVELVKILSESFDSNLLISNGHLWGHMEERELIGRIQSLEEAGLTKIAFSRHGISLADEARIMGIEARSDRAGMIIQQNSSIALRSICVLQKGGVETADDVGNHLAARAREGIQDVCFKELYVSSLSENPRAASSVNAFCEERQVPLSQVITALSSMGFTQTSALPWGAPVFEGKVDGVPMSIAAYTEPSVGWESAERQARSWNLFADGRCLASLEDEQSALSLDDFS